MGTLAAELWIIFSREQLSAGLHLLVGERIDVVPVHPDAGAEDSDCITSVPVGTETPTSLPEALILGSIKVLRRRCSSEPGLAALDAGFR